MTCTMLSKIKWFLFFDAASEKSKMQRKLHFLKLLICEVFHKASQSKCDEVSCIATKNQCSTAFNTYNVNVRMHIFNE